MFLYDLRDNLFFLFLGSASVAAAAEWCAGKLLERIYPNAIEQ